MAVKIDAYPSINTLDIKSTKSWQENYNYYIEEKIDGSQFSVVSCSMSARTLYRAERARVDSSALYNVRADIEHDTTLSQLSIIIEDGVLLFYNKHKRAGMNNSFEKAITMLSFKYNHGILNPNYTYHGESVCRIKHNVCVYERTPKYYFSRYYK